MDDIRINKEIRAREVQLIGVDGSELGVTPLREALRLAKSLGLDLAEVAPAAEPPVCKIMDFVKFKSEWDERRRSYARVRDLPSGPRRKRRPPDDEGGGTSADRVPRRPIGPSPRRSGAEVEE